MNISTRNLLDTRLVECVREVLASEGLPAECLVLEITESALMADQDRAVDTIARLRGLGVGVSIDDYGTGYSSIAYLRRLGADEVKIDRSFVAAMRTDPDAEAIVRATLDLAHVLGFGVVAEGVEDALTLGPARRARRGSRAGLRDRPADGGAIRDPLDPRSERPPPRGLTGLGSAGEKRSLTTRAGAAGPGPPRHPSLRGVPLALGNVREDGFARAEPHHQARPEPVREV